MLGYQLGSQEATAAEINTYISQLDAASTRVVSGQFATSWEGRALKFAIVGRPQNMTSTGLAAIRAKAATLRNPLTPTAQAANLAATSPAILWLAGNVHGNEESGADADLRILYELADRDDCAAQILDNAIVVIAPRRTPTVARTRPGGITTTSTSIAIGSPDAAGDGREARAHTPIPAVLFIDAHEMGGQHYFFPPNKDPIYHEVPDTVIDWQDKLYGPAIQAEFTRQHIQYFNDELYDFLALVYGDTVPTLGFGANGMTFEKYSVAPISERTSTTFRSGSRSRRSAPPAVDPVCVASGIRRGVLPGRERSARAELRERQGVEAPFQVPIDPVRHYFLRDDPAKRPELQALVRASSGWMSPSIASPRRLPSRTTSRTAVPPARPTCPRVPTGSRWLSNKALDPRGC